MAPLVTQIWHRMQSSFGVGGGSDCAFACMTIGLLRQVSTSRVADEDEAPDTGGTTDEQAHGQHCTVRQLPAQPADKKEAQDDLHSAQAVHQAVGQLAEVKEALRHRSHHCLGDCSETR